jgi:membrane protease YdiL (CAAX protease family)
MQPSFNLPPLTQFTFMQLYDIFYNRWERPRSGWRFAIFIIVAYALVIALSTLLIIPYVLSPDGSLKSFFDGYWGKFTQELILFVAMTVGGWFCGKLLEGLPARALGWGFHKGWLADWLKGSLAGALSLILATLIILVGGGYKFSFAGAGMARAVLGTLLSSGFFFIFAAATEEVMFRGYALQTFTRAHLGWLGLLITSLIFALFHMGNPNVVPGWTFLNTALAGVWLAVGYLRTRSLWFPLGMHWSWNWTMGALLGLPVSGIESLTRAPLLRAADTGPQWLTGGDYGVEGGVACTVAILVSTIFIWRTRTLSPTPEMLSLTDKENPKQSAFPSSKIFVENPAGEDRTPLETNS